MISAVIIDDQQECIDDLVYLIEKNKLPVNVLSSSTSGAEGLAAILKHKPELVFLDIVMPGMSGFELLDLLPNPGFQLIITTSNDKFAIQAIRSSALDFLLKPVNLKELNDAVNHSIEKKGAPSKAQLNLLQENLKDRNRPIRKIALSDSEGVELVEINDILYFESEGNYTTVFIKGGKNIVVSKPIGKFEDLVDPSLFFRVHNSFLVNLDHIKKFIRGDGGYIILEDGKTLSVSRNRKEAFLKVLDKI